jgi:hypothetical protein
MSVLAKATSNLTKKEKMFSQLRVAVVRSEQLVAETGESSGTQRKRDVRLGSRYQATASED